MNDKPSRSTLDGVDELWDDVAADGHRGRGRARSPTRSGTNPWDDRTLALLTAAAGHVAMPVASPPSSSRKSPTRSGTASMDELLPPAIRHRDEARARAAASAARAEGPIRGGTRSWDDLLTELRSDAGAQQMLTVSANDTVFGGDAKDPFEELSTDLRDWLAPASKPR